MSQDDKRSGLIAWCEAMAAWCDEENTEENARQFTGDDKSNWLACATALKSASAERAQQTWCPHVGGLGPPFPFCEICARAPTSSELARLREFQREIEEAEARCCPEDVGFEEWIGVLKRQVGERDVQIGTLTAAINAMNQAPNSATSAHVARTGVAGAKYCPHGFDTRLECGACLRGDA